MSADKALVSSLRNLLDKLADSRNLSSDEQEEIHDEVIIEAKRLDSTGFLAALDEAVGKSKSRRKESVYLLSEFTHLPEVIARMEVEFKNPNSDWRHWLIQTIGHNHLIQLAPNLVRIIESDPDAQCRASAIWSAGRLRADCCLPVLLKLTEHPSEEWKSSLTSALVSYNVPAARAYFEQIFKGNKRSFWERLLWDRSAESVEQVIAAWGLAKLGDKEAMRYLLEILFAPDKRTLTGIKHSQSFRAAQAICDIKGWDFTWNRDFIHARREKWRNDVLADLKA